jgi:hypothetical protein
MKALQLTGILALALVLFSSSSCIYVDNDPNIILEAADLEVQVHTPSGFAVEGAEITLYYSYDDALNRRYPIATDYSDRFGTALFFDLPAGRKYFARAQGSAAFSLGSVYIEHQGLWILPMELY